MRRFVRKPGAAPQPTLRCLWTADGRTERSRTLSSRRSYQEARPGNSIASGPSSSNPHGSFVGRSRTAADIPTAIIVDLSLLDISSLRYSERVRARNSPAEFAHHRTCHELTGAPSDASESPLAVPPTFPTRQRTANRTRWAENKDSSRADGNFVDVCHLGHTPPGADQRRRIRANPVRPIVNRVISHRRGHMRHLPARMWKRWST